MTRIEIACINLKAALNNELAVQRLNILLKPHWEHPAWKEASRNSNKLIGGKK